MYEHIGFLSGCQNTEDGGRGRDYGTGRESDIGYLSGCQNREDPGDGRVSTDEILATGEILATDEILEPKEVIMAEATKSAKSITQRITS